MAFTGVTPEAMMARSDSRNPATTCKGLTKSGRPCRRPIEAEDGSGGVVAVSSLAENSDEDDVGAAAFFCWQHKDQAERLAAQATTGPATQLYPLKERNSIDSLVQRLGVLDVGDLDSGANGNKKTGSGKPPRLNRPATWGQVEGPLMSVPSDVMAMRWKDRKQKKKHGFLWRLCCGEADDEDFEAVREKKRRDHAAQQQQMQMQQQRPHTPEPKPVRTTNADFIPSTLAPELASTLLAELEKPISAHDEPGYIYIFWLTAEDHGPAPSNEASTLLTPPKRAGHNRRTSDVMRQYSVKNSGGATSRGVGGGADHKNDTILLKIGRANNVTRRMNEWTRQCGYALSLVRFYPYVSSAATPSPAPSPSRAGDSDGVRKVPNVNRVERLIHLELGAQRVLRKCEACGKEHREWFEVEANRDGVKMVDEVIKRWVEWAEMNAGS
jgi:hypothetical protein